MKFFKSVFGQTLIVSIIMLILFCIALYYSINISSTSYTTVKCYELYALKLNGVTNINGHMNMFLFIGSGEIHSDCNLIYTYAIKGNNDEIKIFNIKSDNNTKISLFEIEDEKPHVKITFFHLNKYDDTVFKKNYIFYVPRGSIVSQYNIDINKISY
jgi:hypothetical protein